MSANSPSENWVEIERSQRHKSHQTEVKRLTDKIKNYEELVDQLESQLNVALSLGRDSKQIDFTTNYTTIDVIDGSEAVAVAMGSDWHVEETVLGQHVNGLNEYNLTIAQARIEKFFRGIIRLTEIQRSGAKISTLLLWLGGDQMTGYIHEELAETNSLSPTETIIWLEQIISEGVKGLEPYFDEIIIPTSFGNHGRTTRKPRHATGAKNSYEWMLFKMLESKLTSDKVKFQVSNGYHNIVEVYGKKLRFHHGDQLRYQGGIGGLTIPVEKAIAAWNKSPVKADLDIFGHWHTYQQNRNWLCNSSLIGYNAFALSIKAPYEPPAQTFFLMDKDRGRTITTPILF